MWFMRKYWKPIWEMCGLEADMGDVWIGTYKLFVAVARFADGNVIDRPMENRKGKAKIANNNAHANPNVGGAIDRLDSQVNRGGSIPDVGGGRSFLDSVLNMNKVDVIKIDDNVEGFVQWHGVALVGKVVDFLTLTSLKKELRSNGWTLVSIKRSDRFLGDKNMWARWFEGFNRWDGNTKGVEERLAWLQVHGVPVQLALDQVFSLVGGRYGKVVRAESMSVNDKDFSYTYIGVLCKTRSRIADRVDINWRGVTYNVWIDEDVGEWVPDCVEDFEDDNDSFEQVVDRDVNMTCNYEEERVEPVSNEFEVGEIRDEEVVTKEVHNDGDCDGTSKETNGEASNSAQSGVRSGNRKKFRKKRGESGGSQERPKKRFREDNDMFGLDKLIGIMSSNAENTHNEESHLDGSLMTTDLKKSLEGMVDMDKSMRQPVGDIFE
ncbi:hypothetical protein HanIR_Chr03g0121051 [Helianthus annuus]|nr:hypothetical protein HanIR_Chr03g0121051 [Helianthus annuus]